MTAVDPDEARRLLEHELQRPEYQDAHATWWDRLSASFLDWLASLRPDHLGGTGFGRTILVIGIVVVAAVVVLVVVTRGIPRRRARLRDRAAAGVFDADDTRSARELAAAARAAASAGDWEGAVLDGFRAIARGLGERDLVPDVPGATAHTIAAQGGTVFPDSASALDAAAARFDAVRYLGEAADQRAAILVLETERAVAAARPARATGPAVPA